MFKNMIRVRTILVSGIKYQPTLAVSASIDIHLILSLYSHAILVSSDCYDVTTAVAFVYSTRLQHDGRRSTIHLSGSISQTSVTADGSPIVVDCWVSTHPLLITAAVNSSHSLGGRRPLEGHSLWLSTRSPQHYADWNLALQYTPNSSSQTVYAAQIVVIDQQTMSLHDGLQTDFSAWEATAQLPPAL